MPDAHVVGENETAGDPNRDAVAAIVLGGTKGEAHAHFDGVAACMESGTAKVSKRGVAVVKDGGGGPAGPATAAVGDGAVAVNLKGGTSACWLSAIATVLQEGHVSVQGAGSLGVLMQPGAHSTGRLGPKSGAQSLLLFADKRSDGIHWVIGLTGQQSERITVQDCLKPDTAYRLENGQLVEA